MAGPGLVRHRLVAGYGMLSDDTEHLLLTAAAWSRTNGEVEAFRSTLASHLRWWFVCLPPAVGLATARACIKLVVGISPHRSGVASAGNGACMRAGIIGALAHSPEHLAAAVRASTLITHTDPRAIDGALVVAIAAAVAVNTPTSASSAQVADAFVQRLDEAGTGEVVKQVHAAVHAARRGESPAEFAATIGCSKGVSGYVLHTVPMAIFLWLSYAGRVHEGIDAAVRLGGDTDSVAAIVGGLIAAADGGASLPEDLIAQITDFPCSINALERCAASLAIGDSRSPWRSRQVWALPRNLLFLIVVLTHGLRRLLPPWG
jgi:ADP-ribosyl-[dinitrogen reductase] hydrolase